MLWDETHTISAGPGGCIQAWKLDPDIVVIGKSIGSGIAAGTYGLRNDIGTRLTTASDVDLVDCGGIGGTLAGNALSLCAMRATLENVLTDEAFAKMLALGRRFYEGCVNVIVKHQVLQGMDEDDHGNADDDDDDDDGDDDVLMIIIMTMTVMLQVPWSVVRLGARVEYCFTSPAPRNGSQAYRLANPLIEEWLHMFFVNR